MLNLMSFRAVSVSTKICFIKLANWFVDEIKSSTPLNRGEPSVVCMTLLVLYETKLKKGNF